MRQACLFLLLVAAARADSLTLRDGTIMTGSWAGFSDGQISFLVGGMVKTYPKSEVSKVTFGDAAKRPATVKLGQTTDQVKASLGEPKMIEGFGSSVEVYVYPDLKITFTDGKVSKVE
jgi:outer membrane protein assembly factor BamE (lipoprotein component of BamABCDE complex)